MRFSPGDLESDDWLYALSSQTGIHASRNSGSVCLAMTAMLGALNFCDRRFGTESYALLDRLAYPFQPLPE